MQCKHRQYAEHQLRCPERPDYACFRPAFKLEMMMNRAHQKYAFACRLKRRYLNYNGQRFNNEQSAKDNQQQFRFRQNPQRRQHAAERQRTRITHEHLSRMIVEF